ncbi:MAG: prepilin-type N-terminal cleavage/methylation domain-containing protein [Planctomycetota bacterium]|nr:prepilin-type N-terminal cleavage/methylation domain-containing protein [Planctomycetota bacterium]
MQKKRGFTLIELMIVIAIIAIIAAIAIPNLIEARKHGNEAAAIGALKTISTSQTVFREGDKEGDGLLDYANNLGELSNANLIDPVLGSNTKQGYIFATAHSTATSEFLWFATANPVQPRTTGDRYFATNHSGVIYYTGVQGSLVPINNSDCVIPTTMLPVGK